MIITVALYSLLHRKQESYGAFEFSGLLLQSSDNGLGLTAADPVKYSVSTMPSLSNNFNKEMYLCGDNKWHKTAFNGIQGRGLFNPPSAGPFFFMRDTNS